MAIAPDAQGQGYILAGSSLTWSHTCSGSDRILWVQCARDATVDNITGVTYNGVAMTLLDKQTNSTDRIEYVFYLIAPDTGTHDVVVSASLAVPSIFGNSSSYTGAKQSGVPDASTKQSISGSPYTTSLTTIADNCWTILFTTTSATTPVASTGSTLRASNGTVGGEKIFDSNGPITPAGNYDMLVTGNGGAIGFIMASFAPAGAVGGNEDNFFLLG
jgi:hypothetical protein